MPSQLLSCVLSQLPSMLTPRCHTSNLTAYNSRNYETRVQSRCNFMSTEAHFLLVIRKDRNSHEVLRVTEKEDC